MGGVFSAWQVRYEVRDVNGLDTPTVLGPYLHRARHRDGELPPVAGDVVVDAVLNGAKQRRFPVIAAADDQGDPLGHPHPRDGSAVWRLQRHREGLRRLEDRDFFSRQGAVVHTAPPGEYRAVRDEGDEPSLGQLVAERRGVFGQLGVLA